MSLINTLTRGLIYKDGEEPVGNWKGGWQKDKDSVYWVSSGLLSLLHVYLPLFPIWVVSLLKVQRAQKFIGRRLGFGSCAHCGMPWKYGRGKVISFSEDGGMFPVCAKCFDLLSTAQLDIYIEALVRGWQVSDVRYGRKWERAQTPEQVIVAAQAEMRRMKGAGHCWSTSVYSTTAKAGDGQ